MDVNKLFHSCKVGDLQRVQYLIDEKDVEVNIKDKWDSTPLYYACLCGHKQVVKFLLENGAKCEANTFEGERCLYGALTDDIRNVLKRYNMISSRVIRRDSYEEFLRKLNDGHMFSDVEFYINGVRFLAHKCILSARCDYFASQFKSRWKDRQIIEINHHMIQPQAFESILRYIYTGYLETHIDNIDDCIAIAKQCQLQTLLNKIEDSIKKKYSLESMKPSVKVTRLVVEPEDNCIELQIDFGQLAQTAVPLEYKTWMMGELPFEPEMAPVYCDVRFKVEGHIFNCHKAFFCSRSDYFKVLIDDHFGESYETDNIPVINVHNVTIQVFLCVLYYIYQNHCELNENIVFDVLFAADMYLLPGLKTLCASNLSCYLDVNNTITILQTARLFSLPRLESQCAGFIANNLDYFLDNEEFKELVKCDANSIKEREETDSIDIIDEIRYYIVDGLQLYSDMQEANEKLRHIDDFLFELDLDG